MLVVPTLVRLGTRIELVGPILDQLIAAGFRVSDTIKEEVLRSAGE
jgi:predicted nucleic acid-binding protein